MPFEPTVSRPILSGVPAGRGSGDDVARAARSPSGSEWRRAPPSEQYAREQLFGASNVSKSEKDATHPVVTQSFGFSSSRNSPQPAFFRNRGAKETFYHPVYTVCMAALVF